MNKIKLMLSTILAVVIMGLAATAAKANEGTVELRNVSGSNARCFVMSVLMPEFEYHLLMSCRDLLYPPADNLFSYVLWAVKDNDKVESLGKVGIGRVEFTLKDKFKSLFVTAEANADTNTPSDRVILRGDVKPIAILENSAANAQISPTASPVASPASKTSIAGTTQPKTASESGIVSTIVKVFLYIIVGLVIFVILVTIINARRRQTILPPQNPPTL
jgi:hypothetical protein